MDNASFDDPNQTFDSAPHEGVVKGTIVILSRENEIVYAGPIKQAPLPRDQVVIFNPEDFAKFKAHVTKGKH